MCVYNINVYICTCMCMRACTCARPFVCVFVNMYHAGVSLGNMIECLCVYTKHAYVKTYAYLCVCKNIRIFMRMHTYCVNQNRREKTNVAIKNMGKHVRTIKDDHWANFHEKKFQ